MPSCVICKKAVMSGFILDDECLKRLRSLQTENERLCAYRTAISVEPNEDGEYWCPKCQEQITGYYASYCEYCGQRVELKKDGLCYGT